MAFAGASTYLYQSVAKQKAALRFDGEHIGSVLGLLTVSFVCGPFIMLHMGWQRDSNGGLHMSQALLSAFIAFGWSFVIGLGVLWVQIGFFG